MTRSLHESLLKVQGQESLIFQTYVTFSIYFPNIIEVVWCEREIWLGIFILRSSPSIEHSADRRAYVSSDFSNIYISHVHVPLDTVFNQV